MNVQISGGALWSRSKCFAGPQPDQNHLSVWLLELRKAPSSLPLVSARRPGFPRFLFEPIEVSNFY